MNRPPPPLDREIALIYLLAGTASRRAAFREHACRVLEGADFTRLAAELADRRLLPLIGTRAIEVTADRCPAEFGEAVATALAAARARGLAIEAETRDLCARLDERGIAALPLKGPLLAAAVHGDLGLRETADVDLLVAPAHLHEAARLLEERDYRAAGDPLRANGLPDLHLRMDHPARATVELHWRVHWYERGFSAAMLERAAPAPDGLRRPRSDDLAVSLLLFYARDGFHGVRLAADLAAWSDRHAARLPGAFLEPYARRHPQIAPALTAAATAAERVTGVPARSWLGGAVPSGRRALLAARLADWTQLGERDQLAANISLADVLLAPPGSTATAVGRQLRPRSGAVTPHAAKMLARYAGTLWRLRRGRRWAEAPVSPGAPGATSRPRPAGPRSASA